MDWEPAKNMLKTVPKGPWQTQWRDREHKWQARWSWSGAKWQARTQGRAGQASLELGKSQSLNCNFYL